jgi:uncharacterized membrane protein
VRGDSRKAGYEGAAHIVPLPKDSQRGAEVSPILVVRIVLLALGLLSAVAHWFVPRLTRSDLYFAVTVAPGFRDSTEGRLILRLFRRGLIGASVPALTVLAAVVLTSALPLAPFALLLQLGAYFAVYYQARRRVLPHAIVPTTVREAQVSPRSRRIPGGWVIAAGPFALLAACAGYLGTHWQNIPTRLILNWGAHGQPDRWASRSLGTVFFPFLMAVVILLVLTLLLYGIAHWLRPIYASGLQAEHESRFRRTASLLLLALEYWVALLFAWLGTRPLLPSSFQRPPVAVAMVPGLIAIVGTAILMWIGQGGSRMSPGQRVESESMKPVGDRTEDRFWKLGIFYFNREDPSVMVERRFGIGYTVNFAHPVGWLIIVLPVLALIAVTTTIAVRHKML